MNNYNNALTKAYYLTRRNIHIIINNIEIIIISIIIISNYTNVQKTTNRRLQQA